MSDTSRFVLCSIRTCAGETTYIKETRSEQLVTFAVHGLAVNQEPTVTT